MKEDRNLLRPDSFDTLYRNSVSKLLFLPTTCYLFRVPNGSAAGQLSCIYVRLPGVPSALATRPNIHMGNYG